MSAAIALCALLLAAGSELDQLIEQAESARAAGDWARSFELLERAYALQPSPELSNNMGRALEALGRYKDAAARYQRVLDDPQAGPELRALDRSRLQALSPKLGQAQVLARGGALLWVGGVPAREAEISVAAGEQRLELQDQDQTRVLLRSRALPAGERTTLGAAELGPTGLDAWLVLRSERLCRVERLEIDGYALRASLEAVETVGLAAGEHRLRVVLRGDPEVQQSLQLSPGQRLEVCALNPTLPARPLGALPLPVPSARVEEGSGVGPWILAGSGGVLAGVAAGLYLIAEGNRNTVLDAQRNDTGVVTGLSYAEADRLERTANHQSTAAAVALGAGAAALTGALLWWLSR